MEQSIFAHIVKCNFPASLSRFHVLDLLVLACLLGREVQYDKSRVIQYSTKYLTRYLRTLVNAELRFKRNVTCMIGPE